jgi:hypothetical protein
VTPEKTKSDRHAPWFRHPGRNPIAQNLICERAEKIGDYAR